MSWLAEKPEIAYEVAGNIGSGNVSNWYTSWEFQNGGMAQNYHKIIKLSEKNVYVSGTFWTNLRHFTITRANLDFKEQKEQGRAPRQSSNWRTSLFSFCPTELSPDVCRYPQSWNADSSIACPISTFRSRVSSIKPHWFAIRERERQRSRQTQSQLPAAIFFPPDISQRCYALKTMNTAAGSKHWRTIKKNYMWFVMRIL